MKTKSNLVHLQAYRGKSLGVMLAAGLSTCPAFAANKTWDGGGADNLWKTGANWNANVAPVAGDSLIFTATTRLSNTNDFSAGTAFGGINFLSPAGAFALGGNAITLDGNITNNQPVTTETINLGLALSATRVADVSASAALTLNGVISGTSVGLTKAGAGLLTLGAANTFDGALSVNAGMVSVSSDGNLGAVPVAATPGRVVINNGTLRNTSSFTLNANRGIAVGPGAGRLEQNSGTMLTYRGIIADNGGSGGLTKGGFGTLLLSAPSTYTGPTVVKNGSLNLDLNDATSPANNVISSVSALTLGGENAGIGTANYAALNVTATAVKTQSFAGTTIDIGAAIVRATNANISLGALGHNAGANLVFVTNGASTLRTTSLNENGILGGWVVTGNGTVFNNITMGTEYAAVDGSGYISPYTGYTVHLNASGNLHSYVSSATNLRINGSSSGDVTVNTSGAGTTTDINSLNLSVTRAYSVIVGANNTLRLGRYGAIFKSDFANNITWALGTGTSGGGSGTQDVGALTAGGAPNTAGEINFVMNNNTSQSQGSLNVECRITDNGSGPVTVIKSGPQAMKLRGHNTFSGGMYVLGGRMQLAGSEIGTGNPDGGGAGKIVVMPGAYLFLSGIGTLSGGQAVSNLVQIAGNGTQQEPVGAIRFGNGAHIAGTVELIGDARIGGGNLATIADTGISGKITGNFALDLCAVQTINSFFTLRNPANDWTGTTTFNARNTASANQVNNGASEVIPNGFGKGNVVMNGNTSTGTILWDLNGFNETVNGLETSANNPAGCIIQNGAAATVSTLTVGDNDQSGTFAGIMQDSLGQLALTKISGGRLTLAGGNTYTGPTIISGGVLALSGSGSIAASSDIRVASGAAFDVSATTVPVSTTGALRMTNATTVSSGVYDVSVATLAMTNSALTVSVDPARINFISPALVTGGATNRFNISAVVGISGYPVQFTLIDYTGTVGGAGNNFGLGEVPNNETSGYISNDVANSRIVLVLNNGPKPLTWAGTNVANPTLWDLNTTTNWIAFKGTGNEAASDFNTADSVLIDDTAATNNLTLTSTLEPGGITVNNSTLNYSFNGTGALVGLGGLTKQGSGSLVLNNSGSSSFSGGVNVAGGSLTFAQNNAIAGGTTVAVGVTVQVGTNGNSGNLPSGNVNSEGSLVFNRGSAAYTVANKIGGPGNITKNDGAILTLSGVNNTLTGAVAVVSGTLKAGSANALGTADGSTTISSGATLDVNDFQLNGEPIIVGGAGVSSGGAIINSGANGQINAMGNVTLTADTTFGGTGRWDIRGGLATLSTSGNAYNLTKAGNNQISLVGVTLDSALANINVNAGTLSVETTTSGLGNPASTLTVASGATFQLFANTVTMDKVFVLNGNGLTNTVNNGSGSPTVQGTTTINGNTIFNVGGTALTWNGNIGGSGTLRKTGTATLTLGGNNTYSGNTTNTAGTLVLTGANTGGGAMTNFSGATLSARGSHTGTIQFGTNATFHPGGALAAGTISCGSLLLNNAVLGTDLGFNNEVAQITNDVILVTGNLTLTGLTTNIVQAGFVGAATNGQIITIVQYTGSLVGGTNNLLLVSPPGYVLTYLDPSTTPGSIQIKVVSAPAVLTWRGQSGVNPTFWDIATTANWLNNAANSTFTNFDAAIFDDTALGSSVNLTTAVIPSFITMNNNALSYTFTGSGKLTGSMYLDVTSGGSLTIANSGSNDFTGPIRIASGRLQVGAGGPDGNLGSGVITNDSALVFNRTGALTINNGIAGFGVITNLGSGVVTVGGANTYGGELVIAAGTVKAGSASALGSILAPTTVYNDATLDVGGQTLNLETVTVSGNGAGNNGAIINSSADSLNALGNVTLAGDTRFGGSGRWDIRGGAQTLSTGGNPYNLTKVGTNQISLVATLVDGALANIDVQAGTFSVETTTSSLGNPANTFTLAAGATFQMFNHQVSLDKVFLLTGNGVVNTINVNSGTLNSLVGPVTLNGSCIINITATNALSMSGAIGGSGSLNKNTTGTLNLSGLLSYGGNTTVNGGSLFVSAAAELTNSPVITLGTGTLLDVTGLFSGPTLNLISGQKLQGAGAINGNLNVAVGATVAPGFSAGTLTVTNDIALAGTTAMEVHPAINANDLLRSITGTITYGGALTVTNIGGLLTNGASLKLFNAGSYLGSFSSIQLPGLGIGQSWNTSQLNVDGTISVVGNPAAPVVSNVSPIGGNLVISGGGGVTNGFYSVVTSTDVNAAIATWTVVSSGQFDGNGQFSASVPINLATPQRFFTIRMP